MEAIKIPAIKGCIGNTTYYCTDLTFDQICKMVKKVDGELHTAISLREQIQRSLSDNYLKIKEYILKREDRFFDSLVLAVYDGDPLWTEVRFEIEKTQYCNVGLLEFNGHEKIFPIDGQHRVEGIKSAMQERPSLADQTISVIFVGHQNSKEGMEKSRRIFSTLNRYVKPVRLGDIIALDEDDVVAITTRILLESYPLFLGNKIKASNSKSIPQSDKHAFTSLMTLYECHLALYGAFLAQNEHRKYSKSQIKEKLKYRPSEEFISAFHQYLIRFWDCMKSTYHEIDEYVNLDSENPAAELRSNETGGNLFFRPIGLLPYVEAVSKIALETNDTIDDIIIQYKNINRNVHSNTWDMILWNPRTQKMIMRNQSLVYYLLIKMSRKNVLTERENANMINKYATVFNIDRQEAMRRIENLTI